ncbi:MAG: type II secretion system F family protein [Ardenticatenaceae bacterium]|nr:type II secretion system F family protein [Ardenticatenaceae bacterium]MCB9446344.1 type II secretion system F family protein [Ardenticatenaceae bacterium]
MSLPIMIVAGIAFLLMLGAGIALVAGGRGNVDERLEQFVGNAATAEVEEVIEDSRPRVDVADKLDKVLSGRAFFDPIKVRIAKSDVKLRVSEYIILVVISGFGVMGLGYYFFDGWLMAIVGFVIGLRIPRFYINYAANRRMNTFNGQLGDTLNLWVNALRSGYSVLQAMESIATELPPPVSKEFERVVQEVRLGLGLEQALANMYRRVPSDDLDLVITAVNIQREVGGNLAEVLDTISFTIRERVRIKGEIKTLTAQGRISGWIISLLPVGLGMVLYMMNKEYVSQLWIKEKPWIIEPIFPCGWVVIGVGAILIGIGALAIRKIVDIEV